MESGACTLYNKKMIFSQQYLLADACLPAEKVFLDSKKVWWQDIQFDHQTYILELSIIHIASSAQILAYKPNYQA